MSSNMISRKEKLEARLLKIDSKIQDIINGTATKSDGTPLDNPQLIIDGLEAEKAKIELELM